MPNIVVFKTPPQQNVSAQILDMVQIYLTDLSTLSVPPSNGLYPLYQWMLAFEVDLYLQRMGMRADAPVELVVAFEDATPEKVSGFLLYLPVSTVPDACGVTYMAVDVAKRRQGIGKAMMAEVIARYPHVELSCTVAKVPFYEAQGFQVLRTYHTQVTMNTRDHSAAGMMGTVDAQKIAASNEATQRQAFLVQRWGRKAMLDAEKKLHRHAEQLTRKAEDFVRAKLSGA